MNNFDTKVRIIDANYRIGIPSDFFRKLKFDRWQDIEVTIEFGRMCVKPFDGMNIKSRPYIGIIRTLDTVNKFAIPRSCMNVLNYQQGDALLVHCEDEKVVYEQSTDN